MQKIVKLLCAGLVLVGSLASLPVFGAEGRIPIWFPNPVTPVPYVIPIPGGDGQYILTRNIDATGTGLPAIIVAGPCGAIPYVGNVAIDLNGFTITGDPGGGPVIDVDCVESIVIKNGSIEGPVPFGLGVDIFDVRKAVVEDLKIRNTGETGIAVQATSSFVIRRNLIRETTFTAILVDPTPIGTIMEGSIEHNVIKDSGGGIDVAPFGGAVTSSVSIRNNRVETTTDPGFGYGIHVSDGHSFLIIENTIEETALDGIRLDRCHACKIVNNTVIRAGNFGIFPMVHGIALVGGTGNLFLDNVSTENGTTVGALGDGMHIDGEFNTIRGNVLNNNGGFGLHFFAPAGIAQFNTLGDNTARGNGLFGPVCGLFVPIDDFTCGPTGQFPPDLCNEEAFPSNTSFCTNLCPGPPVS